MKFLLNLGLILGPATTLLYVWMFGLHWTAIGAATLYAVSVLLAIGAAASETIKGLSGNA